ncbi:MAG TPA: tail fiber domain-containing protein [Acetobacteraceae bacterium]|jgi:hypothetical protein|nr:tail fiber domain-containing protein [Acetobacteraceae bacterium]
MLTKIQDTVTYFDGSAASGKIVVTWPPFNYAGIAVAAGQQEYDLAPDGSVVIECYPCVGAQPLGTYYTATYELDKGAVYDEYWLVPATPTTTIGVIRVSVPETPSIMINAQQLTSSGALSGMFLGWNGSNWVPMYPSSFNCAVQSFFGRVGAVMPQTGDYTVAQVTNAVANTRRVIAGSGLSGGGPLTADVTLSVATGGFVPSTTRIIAGAGLAGGGPLTGDVTISVASAYVPQTTQILAGSGLTGGGPLTGNVTLSVLPGAFVPQTTQVIAGAGLTGGGPLTGNVTLSVAAGGFVPQTTQIIAGTGLSGGGPLTGNVTLSVVADTTVQRLRVSTGGTLVATRPQINFLVGNNIQLTATDDAANNRVNVTIGFTGMSMFTNGTLTGVSSNLDLEAGANITITGTLNGSVMQYVIASTGPSGGMSDPTTTKGDLIVRGSITTNRLGVGVDGQTLIADSTQPLGMRWGAGGGGGAQTPWTSNIDGAGFALNNARNIGINQASLAAVPLVMTSFAGSGDATIVINPVSSSSLIGTALRGIGIEGGLVLAGSTYSTASWRSITSLYSQVDFVVLTAAYPGDPSALERLRVLASNGNVGIAQSVPAFKLDVTGDVNVTGGVYRVNGAPLVTSNQTPWTSTIDAAAFNLNNAGGIGVGTAATGSRALTVQSAAVVSFDVYSQNTNPGSTPGMALLNDSNDQVQFGLGGSTAGGGPLRRVAFWITTRDIAFGTGSSFTERMRITAAGLVGIGRTPTTYLLEVAGDVNLVGGVYRVNGVPLATGGGAQTPWTSDINAAGFKLNSAGAIGIGVVANAAYPLWVRGASGASGLSPQSYTTVFFENGSTTYLELAGNASPGPPNCGIVWSSGSSQTSYIIDYNGAVNWVAVGASRPIAIYTNSLERMRITPAGLVGIGTTVPSERLTVTGVRTTAFNAGDVTTWGDVLVENPTQVANPATGIGFSITSTYQGNSTVAAGIAAVRMSTAPDTQLDLVFITRAPSVVSAERMRITAAGLVGIGTSTPARLIDCQAASTNTIVTNASTTTIRLINSDLTVNNTADLTFATNDAGGTVTTAAKVTAVFSSHTTSAVSASLAFVTMNAAVAGERMRIDPTGNVGIGTASPDGHLTVIGGSPTHLQAAAQFTLQLQAGSTGIPFSSVIQFYKQDGTQLWQIGSGAITGTNQEFAIYDVLAATSRMYINAAGNTGFGTNTPGTILHIKQQVNSLSGLRIERAGGTNSWDEYVGGDNALYIQTGGLYSQFASNGSVYLCVTGGSCGIGTTSPARLLDVETTAAGGWAARFGNSSVNMDLGGFVDGTSVAINSSAWPLALQTGGTTRVTITTGGLVGIGTVSPAQLLSVIPSTTISTVASANQITIGEAGNNGAYRLCLGYALLNGAWASVIQSTVGGASGLLLVNPSGGGVVIGSTAASGYTLDVTGTIHCTAGFATTAKGNTFGQATGNNTAIQPTDANIQFYNQGSGNWAGIGSDSAGGVWIRTGGSGTPDARLLITSVGNIGIAQTVPNFLLQIGQDSAAKPGTNTWTVISDVRTKRNVRPFTEGLDTLLKLRPTAFTYNGEASMPDGMEGVGLVAQEAAEVIPSCVRHSRGVIAGEETEVLALNTGDLTWMILNALRQINERLLRLENNAI